LLGLALLAAGCADPGTTENPLNTPEDGPPVVSVCYPPMVTDRAVVTGIAQAACEETEIADVETRYWKRTLIFNDCPVFKKMRASFRCVSAAKNDGAGAAPPETDAGGAVPDTESDAAIP
jgi:hypothetical protein